MSSVKVQGNASGTGIFTVLSPNSNTDRTLTLPDQTGTVLTNAGPYTANASASNGAVTIDASNNVGIGTSSPGQKLVVDGNVRSNTWIGGANGSAPTADCAVFRPADNTLGFSTSNTERARIDSSGNLLVNTTSQFGNGVINVNTYKGGAAATGLMTQPSTNANYDAAGFRNSSGSYVGYISCTASATSYVTSSDYRLKENIQPMIGALAKVAALKPCTYVWKSTGEESQGFIAHELQEVVPDAVSGEKDAVNEDGSIKPQGIDTSFLVATLTAAIQEQQAMIVALKAEVDALKAQLGAQA